MSREDTERFETVAGGLLDELGYPRAIPRFRPERLEAASRIRELFAANVPRPLVETVAPEARP